MDEGSRKKVVADAGIFNLLEIPVAVLGGLLAVLVSSVVGMRVAVAIATTVWLVFVMRRITQESVRCAKR